MRIAYIVPGSGGTFYCENCFRDMMTIHGLRKAGHDVIMVPLYLPMIEDYHDKGLRAPIFFGAINIYLKQLFPFYRKVPRWAEKVFDSPFLLHLAAKQSGSTSAENLEEMTISMLQGEKGNQADELETLINWLILTGKPDVVHLSNALLLGLAGRIKERLKVPVVCSLQDEHTWIDAMDDPYPARIWEIIAQKAAYVETFISVSEYYRSLIIDRTGISDSKMRVIYIGVNPDDYSTALNSTSAADDIVIGYLGRITEVLGITKLVDAFIELKKKPSYKKARLSVTGGKTGEDKKNIALLKTKLKEHRILQDVTFFPKFDLANRAAFFASLTLLAVPAQEDLTCGLASIEAQAAGIPVVAPALGALGEVIEKTGGGLLYNPTVETGLTQTLDLALGNREKLKQMSQDGKEGINRLFHRERFSNELADVYSKLM